LSSISQSSDLKIDCTDSRAWSGVIFIM
jgi:hypothetical protein